MGASRSTTNSNSASGDALFDDRRRNDPSERKPGEHTWRFLDRVDDPVFDRVRRLLNAWYARYPPEHRTKLRGNLARGGNKQFHSAWFELYLHELHRALGFDVVVEPPLPEVAGDPDFLVTGAGGPFLLEATVVSGGQDEGRLARIAQIEEAVGRIKNPDFWLDFDIDSEGDESPSIRSVRRRVSEWLDGLDWARERAACEAAGDEWLPSISIAVGDWTFTFQALPRPAEQRGMPGPIVGVPPSDGGVFNHGATLLDRLRDKADQCRGASVPVIVAVRLDGMAVDDHDLRVALMGPSIGRLSMGNPPRVIETGEHGPGLFRYAAGTWRNCHIAGVLAWDTELRPWSITRTAPTLWTHPSPALELPRGLPWSRVNLEAEPAPSQGAFEPSDVFELPDRDLFAHGSMWPGQPFERTAP
jgi:hypothetical protein